MFALTLSTTNNLTAIVIVALVILAAAFAKVLAGDLAKILSTLILVTFAIVVWTQRASIQQCADDFQEQNAAAGSGGTTECEFLGYHFKIQLPD